MRLGLVRAQQEAGENRYTSPLLRMSLGIAERAELVVGSEYDRDEGQVSDAAIGLKLVGREAAVRWGVETIALLPVDSSHSGVGLESQLLATWNPARMRLHLNAGAIYDPRPGEIERAWQASLLAEIERGAGRAGVELFARRFRHQSTEVQLGVGWIVPAGPLQVRMGLHGGLTGRAPDLTASLWLSAEWSLW